MAFIRKMTAQHSLTISEGYTADSESPQEEKKKGIHTEDHPTQQQPRHRYDHGGRDL